MRPIYLILRQHHHSVYIIAGLLTIFFGTAEHQDVRAVTPTSVIGHKEHDYVMQREAHMSQETRPCRVALCTSGGGARAMLMTLGALSGLEHSGLLHRISYIASLSGSTWPLWIWPLSDMSADQLREHCIHRLEQFATTDTISYLKAIVPHALYQAFTYHRPSLIDVYGAFLAYVFLGQLGYQRPLHISCTDIQPDPEYHPFFLYTSIIPHRQHGVYTWADITPYEVGGEELGYYIPLEQFGSVFSKGQLKRRRNPVTIGQLMGICGSAISVSFQEAIDMYFRHGAYRALRLLPAKMPNFTKKLPETPFSDRKWLTFIDAGINLNIPIPAVTAQGRDIDVIIICDASPTIDQAPELEKAIQWAQERGIPMPEIDYTKAGSNVCSVFASDDPQTPTIIYLPRIKNTSYDATYDPADYLDDHLNTFHFSYTREQAQQFAGLITFSLQQYASVIYDAIIQKSKQLNSEE